MNTYLVQTSDGWTLGVREITHQGPRRGAALLLHAMMVDGRSLDRPRGKGFGSTLAALGFDVHIADLRGRGLSGPTTGEGAQWSYDDLVLRDVPSLVDAVRERSGGPLWLVGHSLGGHVALATAGVGASTIPPDGHVLLGVNVWMPRLEGSRRRRISKALALQVFSRISTITGRFPARRLRWGPVDEAAAYVEDLHRAWRSDAWLSADGRHDYLSCLTYVQGPVLSVVGARDRLFSHVEGARAFVEQLGPGRAEFWYVRDGDYGLARAPDHMGLVTTSEMQPLWEAIGAWMVEHDPRT
ncbi:MAG: alpha/beta fold hydrolase [Deltaproteobacteria bacterium]|nr:MAG: alpha/beta fold hydrolase [Deltaproteobacteria bacterium]